MRVFYDMCIVSVGWGVDVGVWELGFRTQNLIVIDLLLCVLELNCYVLSEDINQIELN